MWSYGDDPIGIGVPSDHREPRGTSACRSVPAERCRESRPGHGRLQEQENRYAKIRESCGQERGARFAPREGWETSVRQSRQGRQSHQPEASHRYRTFRGAQERRQGPKEEILVRSARQWLPDRIQCNSLKTKNGGTLCPTMKPGVPVTEFRPKFSVFKSSFSNFESGCRAAASHTFMGGII